MASSLLFLGILAYFTQYVISQTVHDHTYLTNLDDLLADAEENRDGVLLGNPLLLPKCSNAVLDEHKYNMNDILYHRGIASPWFWSRESLDATIKERPLHRRLKIAHALEPEYRLPWSTTISNSFANRHKSMPTHITRWYNRLGPRTDDGRTYDEDYVNITKKLELMNDEEYREGLPSNAMYYHIEIGSGILHQFDWNNSYSSENVISHTSCGFTFVREPISRFVSGYYTTNRLIYFHNLPGVFKVPYKHPQKFKWWNVSGEPHRVTQFVDDMLEHGFRFVVESPLEHMMSQTGILSISQNDLHFVGKLDKLKDHWHRLYEFCDSEYLQDFPDRQFSRMANYGVKGVDEHPEYAKMMNLEEYEEGDVLPAYKAVADSYDLYSKLVHYYKQDFVCFGFEPDFQGFREKIYKKWNDMLERKKNKKAKGKKGS